MFELVVIYFNDSETYIYTYATREEAEEAEKNIRMAAGNQVNWTGIRKAQ